MSTHESSAYERLRARILAFDLLPGERMSERGLEIDLGTSRTPIRGALMRLQNEGLVQRMPREWRVAPIDLAEVRAVMEFRETVECGVVVLAVERAPAAALDGLHALLDAHDGSAGAAIEDDAAAGLRDGTDFHLALARTSGNRFFVDAMSDMLTRLVRTRWLEVRTPEARLTAHDEHLAILDAVRTRDAARAVDLVTQHSRGTRDRLLDVLADERRRLRGRGMAIIDTPA